MPYPVSQQFKKILKISDSSTKKREVVLLSFLGENTYLEQRTFSALKVKYPHLKTYQFQAIDFSKDNASKISIPLKAGSDKIILLGHGQPGGDYLSSERGEDFHVDDIANIIIQSLATDPSSKKWVNIKILACSAGADSLTSKSFAKKLYLNLAKANIFPVITAPMRTASIKETGETAVFEQSSVSSNLQMDYFTGHFSSQKREQFFDAFNLLKDLGNHKAFTQLKNLHSILNYFSKAPKTFKSKVILSPSKEDRLIPLEQHQYASPLHAERFKLHLRCLGVVERYRQPISGQFDFYLNQHMHEVFSFRLYDGDSIPSYIKPLLDDFMTMSYHPLPYPEIFSAYVKLYINTLIKEKRIAAFSEEHKKLLGFHERLLQSNNKPWQEQCTAHANSIHNARTVLDAFDRTVNFFVYSRKENKTIYEDLCNSLLNFSSAFPDFKEGVLKAIECLDGIDFQGHAADYPESFRVICMAFIYRDLINGLRNHKPNDAIALEKLYNKILQDENTRASVDSILKTYKDPLFPDDFAFTGFQEHAADKLVSIFNKRIDFILEKVQDSEKGIYYLTEQQIQEREYFRAAPFDEGWIQKVRNAENPMGQLYDILNGTPRSRRGEYYHAIKEELASFIETAAEFHRVIGLFSDSKKADEICDKLIQNHKFESLMKSLKDFQFLMMPLSKSKMEEVVALLLSENRLLPLVKSKADLETITHYLNEDQSKASKTAWVNTFISFYDSAYQGTFFKNPFSAKWDKNKNVKPEDIFTYAEQNPASRTAEVLNRMNR